MKFDREKFFEGFRQQFGRITQAQVTALEALLDAIEDDTQIDDLRHIAYILATAKHETAHTFEPIEEYGKGKGRPYGVKDKETGETYYGRGLVQLTWRKNYEKLGERLGVDLVNNPDLALEPSIAWQITSEGMRHGLFTGKDLDDYINGARVDYVNARKIINRLDQAERIARYARQFEAILKASSLDAAGAMSVEHQPEFDSSPSSVPPLPEESTSVTVKDGDVKVETNKPTLPPEKIAIEKPPAKSFGSEIKKDLAVVGGGNIGFQGVRDVAEQAGGWGLSARFWLWVSIFAVVGGCAYILAKFLKWRSEVKRDLELTQQLIAANSTPTNTVQFVDTADLSRLEKEGYKVVRR